MSQMTEVKVADLQRRVAELESFMEGLERAFPDKLKVLHKGFKKWYVCDRFGTRIHDDPLTEEAAQERLAGMQEKAA